ncbi:hypothetical protein RSAG8_12213, partial [Rhizoctonia solani AG-8 WAC10335]
MIAKESDAPRIPADASAPITSAATQTTHALIAKSAFKTLSDEIERWVNLQALFASFHSQLIDSPQTLGVTAEPKTNRLAQSDDTLAQAPGYSIEVQALDELNKRKNHDNIVRLSTR